MKKDANSRRTRYLIAISVIIVLIIIEMDVIYHLVSAKAALATIVGLVLSAYLAYQIPFEKKSELNRLLSNKVVRTMGRVLGFYLVFVLVIGWYIHLAVAFVSGYMLGVYLRGF